MDVCRRKALSALLQADLDLRDPDRSGQGHQRRRCARTDRRRLDDDRHPQLPQRRHAERLGSENQRRRLPDPSRRRVRCGSDHLRRFDGRPRQRDAVPEPRGVRDAAVVGAGHSDPDRHGAGRSSTSAGRRCTPRISASSSGSAWANARRSSGSTSSTCSIARVWPARTPTCRARTSARSSASARGSAGCSCRCGRLSKQRFTGQLPTPKFQFPRESPSKGWFPWRVGSWQLGVDVAELRTDP